MVNHDAVEYAAATLAMEGMPLDEQEKQMLDCFDSMTPEEQEKDLQARLKYYKDKAAAKKQI